MDVPNDLLLKYYVEEKLSMPKVKKQLLRHGYDISVSYISSQLRNLKATRNLSEARRLRNDDFLEYNKEFATEDVIEAIDGFLLGDGCITIYKGKDYSVGRLQCGVEHSEFRDFMMSFFKCYFPKSFSQKSSNMNSGFCQIGHTSFHPDIYNQYLRWYPLSENGKRIKQPPDDVRLTPTSVLLWYLGDGSVVTTKTTVALRLSTDGFSRERVEFLASKLTAMGINSHRNNDNRIYVESKGIANFFALIGKNPPIKCYDYKFDLPEFRFQHGLRSMKEAAKELGVTYNQLSYWTKINRVPCFRPHDEGRPKFSDAHLAEIRALLSGDQSSLPEPLLSYSRPFSKDAFIINSRVLLKIIDPLIISEQHRPCSEVQKILANALDAKPKGVSRVIQIFTPTWKDRQQQVINLVESAAGISPEKIGARKCGLEDSFDKHFLESNHIQGYGQGTIYGFSLKYGGKIVGMMTAAPHHRQNGDKEAIVLNRLCFASGITIQGGASKLFGRFKEWAKNEGYKRIISYSDNCWTEGEVYTQLGFTLLKSYPFDYFYVDGNGTIYSKQSRKKSSIGCPAEIKEADFNKSLGYYRAWDCGKKTWVYTL